MRETESRAYRNRSRHTLKRRNNSETRTRRFRISDDIIYINPAHSSLRETDDEQKRIHTARLVQKRQNWKKTYLLY